MQKLKDNSSFPILFTLALFSQFKHLTATQVSSFLIKINKSNNIFDDPYTWITEVSKRYGLSAHRLNIHQAKEKAKQWLENGVFVLFIGEQILFAQGNPEILNSSKAAVLNSHKLRAVTPTTRWLKVTIKLTQQVIAKKLTIVSSLGILTYEIVTFIAKQFHSPVIIVLDEYLPGVLTPDLQKAFYDKFSNMFGLEKTLFISPFLPEITLPSRKERLVTRDYWVVALAEYLFVAEACAQGNIQRLVAKSFSEKKKVTVFRPTRFDQNTKGNQNLLLSGAESLEVGSVIDTPLQTVEVGSVTDTPLHTIELDMVKLDEYLFHYTRACPGPWPGQSLSAYIQSLIAGESDAGHTAFDTLCRILKEKLIRASNRLIRGKTPVTSFTACLPNELIKIRKWNPALIRWTFEPYGIGIRRNILKKMAIKPVIYAPESKFKKLPATERFRFQLHHLSKSDWTSEKEWRIPGDVLLNQISPEDMVIVVFTLQEATIIRETFRLPVILA
ncbi:MAG: hypothetical protein AB1422_13770 [bacterium]